MELDHTIEQWTRGDYSFESDVRMTESGPDIRLTELEQQLEVAETRCGSLKSQLDYMKMLYQGVQPCSAEELIQNVEQPPQIQQKNDIQPSPREAVEKILEDKENYQENSPSAIAENIKYYEFLKEIRKMREITKELETDVNDLKKTSPRLASKSPNITPRLIERRCADLVEEHEDISAECRYTKQIRKAHIIVGSAGEATAEPVSILKSATTAVTSLHIPEVCEEHDIDDATAFQPSADHSARQKNNITTARNLTSRFTSEDKSECEKTGLAEPKTEVKKQQLVLKLSESMDSGTVTVKRKRVTKVDRKQRTCTSAGSAVKKTLNSKYDDTLSVTSNNKNKRKKGKLRTATSRHNAVTKETNLTDRRESKKRKQKGYSSATHMPHRSQTPAQHIPPAKAEVVEIYHNNALEGGSGSISISSSKHSKHEAVNQLRNSNVAEKDGSARMCSAVTNQQQQQLAHVHQSRNQNQKALQEESETRARFDQNSTEGYQKYSARSPNAQNSATQDSKGEEAPRCCSARHTSRYYDPMITRNYELPTVASKLKKVNRSYFNRFNFRNIPFVVSTSVTPSHNLGLNIQQVLSIMKTRQPMAAGMTPLLIRKMSKGIKPASMLLDRIHDSSYTPKSPTTAIPSRQNDLVVCERPRPTTECSPLVNKGTVKSRYTGCLTAQSGRLQFIPTSQTNSDEKTSRNHLLEEEEDMPENTIWTQQRESGCICCPKQSKSYNKALKQYTSRKSITGNPTLTASALLRERQEEINIGDNEYNQSVSGNAKGIREVLINLHDQFEELNIAYEKLQEEAAKSNNKSITKRITALEKELNAKEDEINAVVGLYKEVLQLKQQVQSIHGKNSFVCITTSGNPSSPVMVPRSGHIRTQLMTNPMQILGKGLLANSREPATATRLTGLLREIQSFQKQLLSL